MSVVHRDPHSGYMTTGHEWNGITELNTPVPRVVIFFVILTHLIALLIWILLPAWPLGRTYTEGVLGYDQRVAVTQDLQRADAGREDWSKKMEKASFAEVQADPKLMRVVRETGKGLFGDNCAACHGRDARGHPGFPNLMAKSMIWGSDPAAIVETIGVGVNSAHPQSRVSQMPSFGRDKILAEPDIEKVAAYVRSLSQREVVNATPPATLKAGKELFATNCSPCHGDDAKGKPEMGAPNLSDTVWLYGGDAATVKQTLWGGRTGHMPTWESRLSAVQRKILALYIVDMRGRVQ